jgi:hypothetical protein
MTAFPNALLVPLPGTLSDRTGDIRIAIPIQPFQLEVEGQLIPVDTSLRLDFIDLPSTDFVKLSGKTFHFPKNPVDGFIDASLYIYHSHHPADINRITFGSISLAGIAVEMDVDLCFDVEGLGEFENAHWIVSSALRHGEKKRQR